MNFWFQLFGLLLIFLLVIIYYPKLDWEIWENKIFCSILLVTYIIQLLACSTYIIREDAVFKMVFDKFYLILVMGWFSLFGFYYLYKLLKKGKEFGRFDVKNVIHMLILCFSGIQLIGSVAIFVEPIHYVNEMIDYGKHVVLYFILFYLLIEALVLIIGIRKMEKGTYWHLVIVFFLQLGLILLNINSLELSIFNIGFIFITFYVYLMLEDISKLKLESVELERDYALSQSIDKRVFLKNLSHEIRTPLNTIDGFSQIILDSDDMKEIKGDVEDIRMASRDLIDVINGMIDLSIIESGTLEIIKENYNVYDMIDSIQGIVSAKLRDQKIEFQVKIEDDVPEVLLGDSERISQIVLNMIMSFIKYLDHGTIFLEVGCVRSNSRCRLKFAIRDIGNEIKKDDLNHFFTNENGSESKNLGFVVSKYLISLMDGKFEVDQSYKEGTLITISIDQKVVLEKETGKSVRKREIKPFYDPKKRILIVDDNKLNLKVASKLLLPYGVQVVEANGGQECLDILDQDTAFDLILMDDLMPGMSGTETLDIIKKIERIDGYYIPIVVLTANAVAGMKEKYLSVGFEDYLAKPIDKYELDRILKKYLKEKK